MIQQFIKKENLPTLRIFFAGWGSDDNLFGHSLPNGVDYLLCYDYRTLDFDYSLLEGYEKIEVVAWSFGVWVASQVMGGVEIARSTAINGTIFPINDEFGIPEAIFEGTLSGFSPIGLVKFRRRMCGAASGVAKFLALEPRRDLEELRDELSALGMAASRAKNVDAIKWDRVIISLYDNIIPTANQIKAWNGHEEVEIVDAYHFDLEIFERFLYE